MSFDVDMGIVMQKGYNTLASLMPTLYPFFGVAVAFFTIGAIFLVLKKFVFNN